MVNSLSLSLNPELKDIDPDLIDEQVIAQAEAKRKAIAKVQQRVSIIPELYQAIEEDNLDTISFLGQDIGIMMKVRERFRDNHIICEYCEYFIRLDQAEMEAIREEIDNDRRTAQEFTRV